MASIYEKDIAGIRKELIKFGKTAYGKTIFFIAYFIPISLFFALIIFAIVGFCSNYSKFPALMMPAVFISFVISFIVANAYYYHELRIFIERKK